jgi:hypothetical protein
MEMIMLACEALAAAELSLDLRRSKSVCTSGHAIGTGEAYNHWSGSYHAGEQDEKELHGIGGFGCIVLYF